MRITLQQKHQNHNRANKKNDKQEDLQQGYDDSFEEEFSRVSDLLKDISFRSYSHDKQTSDIYEQRKYKDHKLRQINEASTIDELKKIFESIRSEKQFKNSQSSIFDSSIWGLANSLNSVKRMLKQEHGVSITEHLVEDFIDENSFIFDKTENIGAVSYARRNVVPNYYNDTDTSIGLVANMMKMFLVGDNVKTNVFRHYKDVNDRLFDWLLDVQHSSQHKNYFNYEARSGPDQDISKGAQNPTRSIYYQGHISNMASQFNRLYDRRVVLENRKKEDILLLNRRYPLSRSRKFINFTTRKRPVASVLNMKENPEFSHYELNLNFSEKMSHEDRMYALVDTFYNRKIKSINDEERQIIKNKKAELHDNGYRENIGKLKRYIGQEFHSDIVVPMGVVKKWIDYKPDARFHNSLMIDSKEKIMKFMQSNTTESVLSGVANKVSRLIDEAMSGDIIQNNQYKPDKNVAKIPRRKRRFNPLGLLALMPSMEKQSTALVTITRRDLAKNKF